MTSIPDTPGGRSGRLANRSIFLVAELPVRALEETDEAQVVPISVQIEEAVISLAQAVFIEQGQLIFLGDRPLARLLSMVVGDYIRPRFAEGGQQSGESENIFEASLTLYVSPSDFQQEYDQFEYDSFEPVEAAGYATVRRGNNPARIVRETSPDALVCIGGRQGTMFEVVRSFRQLSSQNPIFVIADVGGNASELEGYGQRAIRLLDREFERRLAASRREFNLSTEDPANRLIPSYTVMMQELVDELTGGLIDRREM